MRVHKDFPAYTVYPDGSVINTARGNMLKPQENNCGYLRVQLCAAGRQPRLFVHRLVAELYIPNPDNLPQINHLDGNKKNNRVSNLEWCDASHNHKHSFAELGRAPTRLYGVHNGKSKLSSVDVEALRDLAKTHKYSELAAIYGINTKYVGMIVRGDRR